MTRFQLIQIYLTTYIHHWYIPWRFKLIGWNLVFSLNLTLWWFLLKASFSLVCAVGVEGLNWTTRKPGTRLSRSPSNTSPLNWAHYPLTKSWISASPATVGKLILIKSSLLTVLAEVQALGPSQFLRVTTEDLRMRCNSTRLVTVDHQLASHVRQEKKLWSEGNDLLDMSA